MDRYLFYYVLFLKRAGVYNLPRVFELPRVANWPISYKSSLSFFQARLHSVKIDEETQTPEPSEKKEVSLNLRQHPVASTFGIFDE